MKAKTIKLRPLNDKQRYVLSKLLAGWYLDRDGRDGLGGHIWTEGKVGQRISVSDMTGLFSDSLIEWDLDIGIWKLTEAGKAAAK